VTPPRRVRGIALGLSATDHHVRGVLYLDSVRILRGGLPGWRTLLVPDDVALLDGQVVSDAWYPMSAFERLGNVILEHVIGNETDAVRLWGRAQVRSMLSFLPELKNVGDARDSVVRFQKYLSSLFDFPAVTVLAVDDAEVMVKVAYGMGPRAEEAATWQTVGFFEELVTASGGIRVENRLASRGWLPGEPPTRFLLTWATKAESPRPFLTHVRVLVVDDEPLVARGLSRLLRPDVEVTHAIDAAEALQLLETRQFDAVLADFTMPNRDGLSLLEEVSQRWPRLKRVLHSGAHRAEVQRAVARGDVHELLEKPAARDVLLRAISTPAPQRRAGPAHDRTNST